MLMSFWTASIFMTSTFILVTLRIFQSLSPYRHRATNPATAAAAAAAAAAARPWQLAATAAIFLEIALDGHGVLAEVVRLNQWRRRASKCLFEHLIFLDNQRCMEKYFSSD